MSLLEKICVAIRSKKILSLNTFLAFKSCLSPCAFGFLQSDITVVRGSPWSCKYLAIGKIIGQEVNLLYLIWQDGELGWTRPGLGIQLTGDIPVKTINDTRHAQKENWSNEELSSCCPSVHLSGSSIISCSVFPFLTSALCSSLHSSTLSIPFEHVFPQQTFKL